MVIEKSEAILSPKPSVLIIELLILLNAAAEAFTFSSSSFCSLFCASTALFSWIVVSAISRDNLLYSRWYLAAFLTWPLFWSFSTPIWWASIVYSWTFRAASACASLKSSSLSLSASMDSPESAIEPLIWISLMAFAFSTTSSRVEAYCIADCRACSWFWYHVYHAPAPSIRIPGIPPKREDTPAHAVLVTEVSALSRWLAIDSSLTVAVSALFALSISIEFLASSVLIDARCFSVCASSSWATSERWLDRSTDFSASIWTREAFAPSILAAVLAISAPLALTSSSVCDFSCSVQLPRKRVTPTAVNAPAAIATVSMFSASESSPPARAAEAPYASFVPPTQAIKAFSTFWVEADTVLGIESNSACITRNWAVIAGTTLSIVSSPLSAIALRSLRATPIPAAKARMIRSPFSLTELNSSPRNTPCASAWLNCVITELASDVLAPDNLRPVLIASVTFSTSPEE